MATAQHYVWAAGHFLILLTATKYLFTSFMFRYASPTWYKASYFGALVSYSIVCLKSLGVPQPNSTFARRAATDDNVHYLLLALFWFFSKPVPLSLVPYAIFSLFHALTFLRSNALPHFFPPSPPATAGEPAQQHPLLKRIQVWIKTNYDTAMTVVAYTELAILARVIFGALFRMNSLLSPILFAHFVRQRYYQSTFTQRAVAHVNTFVDFYVQKPATPPIVKTIWAQAQVLVGRWAGSVLTRQQPNPTNGARRPTRG